MVPLSARQYTLLRNTPASASSRNAVKLPQIAALTGSGTGLGGLVTLKDSGWVLSLSVFHQPEIIGQPRA